MGRHSSARGLGGCFEQYIAAAAFALLASIQGCGGGGDGGGSSSAAAAPAAIPVAAAGQNVQPIVVDPGPAGTVNLAFTSVTLCAPGSANCATIDHVLVDTGSTGLRIISSLLPASLALPPQTDAGGNPVAECAQFANGFTWGPVKLADLKIAGEQASRLPIQVIDPNFSTVPSLCARTGVPNNTVQALSANGILGLGLFLQDCGNACAQSTQPGFYYACPASGCRQTTLAEAAQVQHPVSMFAVNNNGVIIQLSSVPEAGAARASGALVFGINTQANNRLGTATVVAVDPGTGYFTTWYNGTAYPHSIMDSGSNAFFFQDSGIAVCSSSSLTPGFYCPAVTKSASATIQGLDGASATVSFSVANAASLVTNNPDFTAFNNLGGPTATVFDWGLPFFFGRNVFTAIEGQTTPGGPTGPYLAF